VAFLAQAQPLAPAKVGVPAPPVAKKVPRVTRIHGHVLRDDYAWLREKKSPEVISYLEAENAYTQAVMKPSEALQQRLYEEMISHVQETDEQPPYRDHGWFYYSRTEKGKQYPILCRKKGQVSAPEEVMLDLNQLAKGEKFLSLGEAQVSDDGNLLAYATDVTGFREYTLRVKDLRTGQVLADTMEKTGAVVWAADNKTLFYTVEDAAKRSYRVYRHVLGTPVKDDVLTYEEKDERFRVNLYRSRDLELVFLASGSHTTRESRYLPAAQPTGEWKVILPRQQDIEYAVEHRAGELYLRINDTGRTFRLVKAPLSNPADKKAWTELLPSRPEVALSGVELFRDFYVLYTREDGLPRLRVVDFATGKETAIPFPEPTYHAAPSINAEFDATVVRYSYQSLVTPQSTFDYDVKTGESTLVKQTRIPGGFDRSHYASERVFATAKDGTRVPVSLVYRKDLKKADGSNPLYLYGYGSYGSPMFVGFNATRMLPLLDRGVVVALAHIRGGGDLGRPWHDAGRMLNKRNTFTDFIDVAEHLVAKKYGARGKIAIEGASAGGLLMGAVVNLRPDLFRVVVSRVPFVDVLNTMLDASLPLTVGEYEEWGNPNNKAEFDYMRTYSPYDNLAKKAYPAMLVETSLNDSQVMYWEPAKYVAKLRTLKTDKNPLLLRTNMAAGHGGASGRYDRLKELAFGQAFILTQLGVETPDAKEMARDVK
jgi:oligopeptidase B